MTGFSSKSVTISTENGQLLELTLTLKALNARFLEVHCKLPYALGNLETDIIKRLKSKLVRGTIYCTIQISTPHVLKNKVIPVLPVVESYIKTLSVIQERFDIPGELNLSDLIHLPHIFEFSEVIIDPHTARELYDTLDLLADDLMNTRLAEGKALESDIKGQVDSLRELIREVESKVGTATQERKDQVISHVKVLFQEGPNELRDQQLQLVRLQLNRYELNEEIVRFAAHLESFAGVLETLELEKGKKLDFFTQELFREINTIGSKAVTAEIGNLAISIKVGLEKIREQLQNVL